MPWMRHPASVRTAGSGREQVFDASGVVPQHVAVAHAEAPAIVDEDTPRFEGFRSFFDGLAAGRNAEIRADGAQRLDDRLRARLEIASAQRGPHRRGDNRS